MGRFDTESAERAGVVGRMVSGVVGFVSRRAIFVVVLWVAAAGFFLHYTRGNLGINTDTSSMISEKLDWRRDYLSYKQKFPQFFGEIVIVIDGATPDLADEARTLLAARLKAEDRLFKSVYLAGGGGFFEKNGLLYLDVEKLEDLADNLAGVQPFLGRLVEDQSLVGLTSMLESAMEEVQKGRRFELAPVFGNLSEALSATTENRFYRLSWQDLMLGRTSKPTERRRFIVVQPRLDFTELFQGEAAISRVRAIAGELNLDPSHGVRVRMTGSVTLANEEMKSVSRGAELSGILALLAVCVILYVALRSLRLLFASVITLIVGMAATAAFAAYAVGNLNLISMAFAILYIGLGIDYAIHLSLRYRELVTDGASHGAAIKKAAGDVGASLVLCTVTTSAGFYSFIPTAYSGVSELGLISGTGIFISLIVNLTLLPALISLMPLSPEMVKKKVFRTGLPERTMGSSARYRTAVLTILPVLGIISFFLLTKARFDNNPMNLRDDTMESVAVFNDLVKESDTTPLTVTILKPDGASASRAANRLKKLDTVKRAVTIADFIPSGQGEKLDIIEEIGLLLGPELEYGGEKREHTDVERVSALKDLSAAVDGFIKGGAAPKEAAPARRLSKEVIRFTAALDSLGPEARGKALDRLETSLTASLPERLRLLRVSLTAGPVTFKDLPESLVERWVTPGGAYRIDVAPRENISDPAALERFVGEVRGMEPGATGIPVVILESGRAVVSAFRQALFTRWSSSQYCFWCYFGA